MSEGMLKLLMLKIVSEGDANGYQVMKRAEKVTGKRPSTGSVYPLLMDMEGEGLLTAKRSNGKTVYSITPLGRERLDEHTRHRADFIKRIHESVSIANETFDETIRLEYMGGMDLTSPLVHKVYALLHEGVEASRIKPILDKSIAKLEALKGAHRK